VSRRAEIRQAGSAYEIRRGGHHNESRAGEIQARRDTTTILRCHSRKTSPSQPAKTLITMPVLLDWPKERITRLAGVIGSIPKWNHGHLALMVDDPNCRTKPKRNELLRGVHGMPDMVRAKGIAADLAMIDQPGTCVL
jgi:hypothetical protein